MAATATIPGRDEMNKHVMSSMLPGPAQKNQYPNLLGDTATGKIGGASPAGGGGSYLTSTGGTGGTGGAKSGGSGSGVDYNALLAQIGSSTAGQQASLAGGKGAADSIAQQTYDRQNILAQQGYDAVGRQLQQGYDAGVNQVKSGAAGLEKTVNAGIDGLLAQLSGDYEAERAQTGQMYADAAARLAQNRDLLDEYAQQQYDTGEAKARQQADQSLADAYRTKVAGERNMAEKLAALGVNGGGSVNAALAQETAYGANRNSINTQLQDTVGDLLAQLSDQKSQNRLNWFEADSANEQAKAAALLNLLGDYNDQKGALGEKRFNSVLSIQSDANDKLLGLLQELTAGKVGNEQTLTDNRLTASGTYGDNMLANQTAYNQMLADIEAQKAAAQLEAMMRK